MKRWCVCVMAFAGLAVSGAAQKAAEQQLPYKAVHDPQFIPATSATFLSDPDRVIGIIVGTVAKAYPAAILSQHGLVEDQTPSGPIAITW
jgi:hypothetical protein